MADFKPGDHVVVKVGSGQNGVVYDCGADDSIRVFFPDLCEMKPFSANELEHASNYDKYGVRIELLRNGVPIAEEEESPADPSCFGEIAASTARKIIANLSPRRDRLTTGVFGMTLNGDLFVVVNDHLVYQKGGWDGLDSPLIAVLVNANSFEVAKTKIRRRKDIIWTSPLCRKGDE